MAVKKRVNASVESFIDRGADVKAKKDAGFKNILVRVPVDVLDEISALIRAEPELNRTLWIVQALREKLKREG
jgi:hypothetical protein